MRRISVVLPVYNESESIAACLRGLEAALATEEHEILVCYDTEEDTTLPAIAAMADRPASVRLVRNTLGRGALNAIKTGFAAASGDVVVTSMADLSDPPEVILEMAERIRAGADVVSGSRYMRGGSQTGGPWLKRTLSRIAGVSLRWIAGIGTHDATSNFRGYSKAFLETVRVESRGGFEIALELTVKAHLAGRTVAEVPSSWVDRSAGKSNFRMWRWMPSYLRWYLRAAAEPGFVLGVWLAMVVSAWHLVATYASPIPFMDDFTIVEGLGWGRSRWLAWLWAQHNEHRIPIAKLACWGSIELTRDFRAPMFLQVAALAAAAWVLIVAARRIRGRTTIADAFLPLVFLSWGHFENLLSAFQLALVLPAAIAAAILATIASAPPVLDRRASTWIAVLLAALPLCSAGGLVLALPLIPWAFVAAAASRRSSDPAHKDAARRLLLGAIAAAILVVLYLATFQTPHRDHAFAGATTSAVHAVDLLARGAGPMEGGARTAVRALVAALTLATLAAGLARWRRHPEERVRELGFLACAAGIVVLGAGIGFARGEGSAELQAPRYVTLFTPYLALLYLAWCRYGNAIAGRLVRGGLCVGMALLVPGSMNAARAYAAGRLRDAELLTRDADAGWLPELLAQKHWRSFSVEEERFAKVLEYLRHLGLAPYRIAASGLPEDARIVRPFSLWKSQPVEVRSDQPVTRRRILDVWAIQVHSPTGIVLDVPAGARRLRVGFGIEPLLYSKPKASTTGLRFAVELPRSDGTNDVLFQRVLDPAGRPEDRGIQQAEVSLPDGAIRRVGLRVASSGGGDPSRDWGFWTDVEFDPEPLRPASSR